MVDKSTRGDYLARAIEAARTNMANSDLGQLLCELIKIGFDNGWAAAELSKPSDFNLAQLQAEVWEWTKRNFPNKKPHQPLLGALEELGELAHSHLKAEQGIRGTSEEHHTAKIDAVADTIIYLADYATQNGISLQAAVETTWRRVKARDWITNPQDGGNA